MLWSPQPKPKSVTSSSVAETLSQSVKLLKNNLVLNPYVVKTDRSIALVTANKTIVQR